MGKYFLKNDKYQINSQINDRYQTTDPPNSEKMKRDNDKKK